MGDGVSIGIMKLRYCFLICGLILCFSFVWSSRSIDPGKTLTVDMGKLNDTCIQITTSLQEQIKTGEEEIRRQKLEEEYQCEIVMRDQVDYELRVSDAIKYNRLIVDLIIEDQMVGKIIFEGQSKVIENMGRELRIHLSTVYLILSLLVISFLLYFYSYYVRPFTRLQRFARQISKGNFDFALPMTKSNYFGAFTESFDLMREELKKAKQGEYEANISKKELVASLSHDIKTPVSTIKAICEILMLQLKEVALQNKISIIHQKADVIDALITDMFHATLEDLTVLVTKPTEELSTILKPIFDEMNHFNLIVFENEPPECMIYVDKLRITQVIDNIINNSYKYANTRIHISFENHLKFLDGEGNTVNAIRIRMKDEGKGLLEEDVPYLSEKFYRGSNADGKSGSGLGLYLSKLFMEQMKGNLTYYLEDGFVVELFLRRV